MKRSIAVLVCMLLLSLAGCARSSVDADRPVPAPPQPQERSIDDVVRDLKARADEGDLDYFDDYASGRENARAVMRAIEATDVVALYRDHLSSNEASASIDGHSLGRFQIRLVHGADGWTLESAYPCY